MTGCWLDVAEYLSGQDPGTIFRVPVSGMEHPLDSGMRRSAGLPLGQRSDFRFRLDECAGLHVRDFGTHYEAHIDKVDPSCDPVEHGLQDAPGATIIGTAALGALLGGFLGKSRDALFAGAAIGALVALAAVILSDEGSDSGTSGGERR